jgi:hypothetical protein
VERDPRVCGGVSLAAAAAGEDCRKKAVLVSVVFV